MLKAKQRRAEAARRRKRPQRGVRAVVTAAVAATGWRHDALGVLKTKKRRANAIVPLNARQRTRSSQHSMRLVSRARRHSACAFGEDDGDFAPVVTAGQLLEDAASSDALVDTPADTANAAEQVRLMAVAHRFLSVAPAVRRELRSARSVRGMRSALAKPLEGDVQGRGAVC